jgi:lipid II:glycine glycyltransferase (peptidoglycan interpeptide bridge formation enzyme)
VFTSVGETDPERGDESDQAVRSIEIRMQLSMQELPVAEQPPATPSAETPSRSAGRTPLPADKLSAISGADQARSRELLGDLNIVVSPEPGAALIREWDELVRRTVNTDVAQLSAWAAVRALAGYDPLYLLARSGSRVIGGGLVLWRKVRGFGQIGYLPYGPVLDDDLGGARPVVRNLLTSALVSLAHSRGALFVQPLDGGEDVTIDLLRQGFRFSQAGIAPAATMRVDLTQTEDELRANLNRRLRTWTRQWAQRGVKVRVGDERDIPMLTRLAASTAHFQGFEPFPREYLDALYHQLSDGENVVLLLGELDGEPVAAELLTGVGGVLKSRITGMDRSSPQTQKLNVASAMIWEAICWGKANGYRAFDFGGLRPESVAALRSAGPVDQEALAGPDMFKAKFGGEAWVYPPAVELISSRVVRAGYDLLRHNDGGQKVIAKVREMLRGGR